MCVSSSNLALVLCPKIQNPNFTCSWTLDSLYLPQSLHISNPGQSASTPPTSNTRTTRPHPDINQPDPSHLPFRPPKSQTPAQTTNASLKHPSPQNASRPHQTTHHTQSYNNHNPYLSPDHRSCVRHYHPLKYPSSESESIMHQTKPTRNHMTRYTGPELVLAIIASNGHMAIPIIIRRQTCLPQSWFGALLGHGIPRAVNRK